MLRGDNSVRYGWVIGEGLAPLAAAVYMIRDGKMKGENITMFENRLHSSQDKEIIQEDKIWKGQIGDYSSYTALMDLLEKIPSVARPGKSAKEELVRFNQQIAEVIRTGWHGGEQTLLNQYHTLLLSIKEWLRKEGVVVKNNTQIKKLGWEKYADTSLRAVRYITYKEAEEEKEAHTGFEDLIFVTNGYMTKPTVEHYHNLVFFRPIASINEEPRMENQVASVKKVIYELLNIK